jgi:hypothetical protein
MTTGIVTGTETVIVTIGIMTGSDTLHAMTESKYLVTYTPGYFPKLMSLKGEGIGTVHVHLEGVADDTKRIVA